MSQRVFVTGGSGFVGQAVIRHLLARGYHVRALTRQRPIFAPGPVENVPGDLLDPRALDQGMAGCDAIIHLVGIIMEWPGRGITFERIHHQGTVAVVEAAGRGGVKRMIHMSALGTRPGAASRYHQSKFQAEEAVRHSSLQWTILQPSLIHGPGGDFMKLEAAMARGSAAPFFAMPYFGAGVLGLGGSGRLQPVYVEDVARAVVDALALPATIGQTYALGGPEAFTWPAFHRICTQVIVGRQKPTLGIPAWLGTLLATIVPNRWLGFSRDQVLMSRQDNICNLADFTSAFGWAPMSLHESLTKYVKHLP